MKKSIKRIISLILSLTLLCCATLPVFAAGEEKYISELRLIYAEDYNEATEMIKDSEFKDYKVLKANLNENSGEIGVWLAYKTTTDIEDAITDLSIMQMNGGYRDGNFQALIQQSYSEYAALGEIYLDAINYFAEAYDAGDFLAGSAYRQLNFYNIVSENVPTDKIPTFEGERLGDIFYSGNITKYDLATMFLEGNSYALKNIRSLISMGVAYNEDGMTYLEKVGESAELMNEDSEVFDGEDYDELASAIELVIPSIQDLLKEMAIYEEDFDYTDDNFTAEEIRYLEVKAVADMLRDTQYLGEQTLYDFFINYTADEDEESISLIYPLVDALNEGQVAMTKVAHYYDVIRYSAVFVDEETINSELDEMEKTYSEKPFNLYTGVDRTIYNGTFAVTTEADRADAYSETDMMTQFFGNDYRVNALMVSAVTGVVGYFMIGASVLSRHADKVEHASAWAAYKSATHTAGDHLADVKVNLAMPGQGLTTETTNGEVVKMLYKIGAGTDPAEGMSYTDQLEFVFQKKLSDSAFYGDYHGEFITNANNQLVHEQLQVAQVSVTAPVSLTTGLIFTAGALLTLYSAYKLGMTIHDYYHPDYDDIPLAMVDLVNTVDGDRYIKYDVVYNIETNDRGVYDAGDLNAFEGKLWNALYYTKSYEAGKPLLADSFVVNNTSNAPKSGYTPVHLFGEVVCYNLNKYNYSGNTNIYLSVKQSKNDKAAVADVPEVVGSMVGTGFLFLAGGLGAAAGVGATIATHKIIKSKKKKVSDDTPAVESTENT